MFFLHVCFAKKYWMQALETDLTTPWLKDRGPIDSQSDDGDLIGLRIVAWTILMKPYLVGVQIQVPSGKLT
jgi:hypothetical protein